MRMVSDAQGLVTMVSRHIWLVLVTCWTQLTQKFAFWIQEIQIIFKNEGTEHFKIILEI